MQRFFKEISSNYFCLPYAPKASCTRKTQIVINFDHCSYICKNIFADAVVAAKFITDSRQDLFFKNCFLATFKIVNEGRFFARR